jgi:hypothetical protein
MIQNSKVLAGSTIGKKYCVSLSENSGFSTFLVTLTGVLTYLSYRSLFSGDIKVDILNGKGESISKLPGDRGKRLLVEMKVIWHGECLSCTPYYCIP